MSMRYGTPMIGIQRRCSLVTILRIQKSGIVGVKAINSRFTCPEKEVPFFANSRRKNGFQPVEGPYFCLEQQKKKNEPVKKNAILGHVNRLKIFSSVSNIDFKKSWKSSTNWGGLQPPSLKSPLASLAEALKKNRKCCLCNINKTIKI